jgi:asparagine synthase (glutamine-hydrolysing)
MCGIVGIVDLLQHATQEKNHQDTVLMSKKIIHRGPDAFAVWSQQPGIVLAHRRLAIQDLSALGAQPMHSHNGAYTIVFNGEIYNFKQIKQRLKADFKADFTGHSDTEVLLSAIEHLGIEATLGELNGMFAFALWDHNAQTLTLAQDRAAKKPLYFGFVNQRFVFASQLKAITALPEFSKTISRRALQLYLQKNYVPAPYSIYQGIYKLEQGCSIAIDRQSFADKENLLNKVISNWSPYEAALMQSEKTFSGNFDQAKQTLNDLLLDATQLRMISDVPVGVMLSGGIDSTLISSLAQQISNTPIKTFSIGFTGSEKSEAAAAKTIASYLKTDHCELYLTGQDALDVIPSIPDIFDEPFGDSSQVPTYLVSQLAKSTVTVALTGDGGDELFYGYKRYFSGSRIYHKMQSIPVWLRNGLALTCQEIGKAQGFESAFLKHASMLKASHPLDMYNIRMHKFFDPAKLILRKDKYQDLQIERIKSLNLPSTELNMMLYDYTTYLTGDILTKVDRASMAVSLEARSPLLDKRVVEFAWQLPQEFKAQGKSGKRILKSLLNDYVPIELTDRPKQGFGSPIKDWLNGPLKEWADELLNKEKLIKQGVFDADLVRELWDKCIKMQSKSFSRIWTILMFQAWYDNQL